MNTTTTAVNLNSLDSTSLNSEKDSEFDRSTKLNEGGWLILFCLFIILFPTEKLNEDEEREKE